MADISFVGPIIAVATLAGGALVGYGMLRQKVAALEVWKQLQEISNARRDEELSKLLEVAAATTANVAALTANMDRMMSRCDTLHMSWTPGKRDEPK